MTPEDSWAGGRIIHTIPIVLRPQARFVLFPDGARYLRCDFRITKEFHMMPGFTGLLGSAQVHESNTLEPAVRLAGLWDIPPDGTCRFSRTDVDSTLLVQWCTVVYLCW